MAEEKEGEKRTLEEVEELRGVLGAISEFLTGLREPIKELIDTLMSALDGKKLGEEVAEFYSKLRDSGVPEDLAEEMVRDYFKKKLEAAPSIGDFVEDLRKVISREKPQAIIAISPGDIDKALTFLKKLKEESPEKGDKIDKVVKILEAVKETSKTEKEEEKEET